MANNYKTTRHQDLKTSRPQVMRSCGHAVMWSCGLILFFLVISLLIIPYGINTVPAEAASVPQLINYQGKLTDRSGVPREGIVSMTFSIWSHEDSNDEGAYLKWRETHSMVYVRRGIFSVLMGSVDPIPPGIFGENKNLWLGITVDTDSEMRPRAKITTMGYAFNADRVQGQGSTDNIFPSSGKVGIGTTSPYRKLDVRGSGGYDGLGIISDATGGRRFDILSTGGSASIGQGKLTFYDGSANAHRMVIDSSGNVGIGTTSPGAKLEVVGNVDIDSWAHSNVVTNLNADKTDGVDGGYRYVQVLITVATYNGNLGGIAGANARCQAEFPGYHFCGRHEYVAAEKLDWIKFQTTDHPRTCTLVTGIDGTPWMHVPGTSPCATTIPWTSSDAAKDGTFLWGGPGSLACANPGMTINYLACNQVKTLACCK